eukprot:656561-Pleurochrysis_carterae.AAC.1
MTYHPAEGPWRRLAVGAAKWPMATGAATPPSALQRVPPQDPEMRFNVCCACVRAGASDAVTPGPNVPAKQAAQTADGTRRSKPKTDDGEQ